MSPSFIVNVPAHGGCGPPPLPADDPKRCCPDTGNAGREPGGEPRVALDDGLHETIARLRHELGLVDRRVSRPAVAMP